MPATYPDGDMELSPRLVKETEGDFNSTGNSKKILVLLFLLLIFSAALPAQDWRNVCPPGTLFYLHSPTTLEGFRYDSVQVTGGQDSLFFSFPRILQIAGASVCDSGTGSLLGRRILKKSNGWLYITNYNGDTLSINMLAGLNQSWHFMSLHGAGYIRAQVTQTGQQTILGSADSVKTLEIQAFDSSGNPVAHAMNNRQILLSKVHGIVQTFDLALFPLTSNDYSLAGTTHPKAGIQPLSWKAIYHFSPGDEFQYLQTSTSTYKWTIKTTTKTIRTILSATWTPDSASVTYHVHECVQETSNDVYPYEVYHTTYSDDTRDIQYNVDGIINSLAGEFDPAPFCTDSYSAPLYQQSVNSFTAGRRGFGQWYFYYLKGPSTANQWKHTTHDGCYDISMDQFVQGLGVTHASVSQAYYDSETTLKYANIQGTVIGTPLFQDCSQMLPYFTPGKDTIRLLSPASSTDTLSVSSNTKWQVSAGANWFSVSRNSGYGSGLIIFKSVTENTGPADRSSTVNIGGIGMAGNVITVIQAHRPEGIDDPASRKVLIRPNPMRESATVTVAGLMTGQVLNYTLLDLTGRVMTRGSFTGNSTVIRQNALPGGIYLLRISDQSGVYIICTKLVVI